MAGGRDDAGVDPMEGVSRRSSSIWEVTNMNAHARTAGTPTRPAVAYRQLVIQGLTPGEAANVTAVMRGIPIPIGPAAWTLREINHLLFLRAMRDAGRFASDDRAA
jgi:hypothetical protein